MFGVAGGVRTLGHRNHNPALYQLSYSHHTKSSLARPYFESPALFHKASTRSFTSGSISITFGQRRVKPSLGHFLVASTPILEP